MLCDKYINVSYTTWIGNSTLAGIMVFAVKISQFDNDLTYF